MCEQVHEPIGLGVVEPRRGLVEHDEGRSRHQRSPQLHEAEDAKGKVAHRAVGDLF